MVQKEFLFLFFSRYFLFENLLTLYIIFVAQLQRFISMFVEPCAIPTYNPPQKPTKRPPFVRQFAPVFPPHAAGLPAACRLLLRPLRSARVRQRPTFFFPNCRLHIPRSPCKQSMQSLALEKHLKPANSADRERKSATRRSPDAASVLGKGRRPSSAAATTTTRELTRKETQEKSTMRILEAKSIDNWPLQHRSNY